jgi:hypothetical protein
MYKLAVLLTIALAAAIALSGAADAAAPAEVAKLLPSDAGAGDLFGRSVSVSGDIAIVGAYLESAGGSGAGAAYIFERDHGGADGWGEAKKLTAPQPEATDSFGFSVAVSGTTAVVGMAFDDQGGSNTGAAFVYERNHGGGGNWGLVKKLTASDAHPGDFLGYSVAIHGHTIVLGALFADGVDDATGAAYIFERDRGGIDNWGEAARLTAADGAPNDSFGSSVAISGSAVIVGAPGEDAGGSGAGAAYVFERDRGGADAWGQVQKLVASDAAAGARFGESAAAGGAAALVGASGTSAGAAYVFERDRGGVDNWGETKKLTASDAQLGDAFGIGVALDAGTALVGAYFEDARGNNAGAADVFERDRGGGDNWGEAKKLTASDAQPGDRFGSGVALSDSTALIGAYYEDTGGTDAGAAYVFASPANFDGDLPPYGNGSAGIDNGPGIAGQDGTVPNSDASDDTLDPDDDNDGLPDAAERSPTPCLPFDLSTTAHPNPARGDNTDLDGNGPSWDTDQDGVLDGAECALGTNPRDPASRPSRAACGGESDADHDGLTASAERCRWGTSDTLVDSDGDGRKDCLESNDTNSDGMQDFAGDTMNSARAAFGIIVATVAFDMNGDGTVNFTGDSMVSAKIALQIAPIIC